MEFELPPFRSLLRIICSVFCPPCPSRIASKLAFHPPPPTYYFEKKSLRRGLSLMLTEEASWHLSIPIHDIIHVNFATSKTGNAIACAYINCNPTSKYTVLVSHPNAIDLGETIAFCVHLSNKTFSSCNFFIYDYSGYGISSGSPSPKNVCDDIQAAYNFLRYRYNVNSKKIVLYGQSIGSVPSIDLASKQEVGGLILVAPLSSGIGTLLPGVDTICCCDPFPNLTKVKNIKCKVLVIHGSRDCVIPVNHSQKILKELKNKVHPLFIKDADHNDIAGYPEFFDRFYQFISCELQNP